MKDSTNDGYVPAPGCKAHLKASHLKCLPQCVARRERAGWCFVFRGVDASQRFCFRTVIFSSHPLFYQDAHGGMISIPATSGLPQAPGRDTWTTFPNPGQPVSLSKSEIMGKLRGHGFVLPSQLKRLLSKGCLIPGFPNLGGIAPLEYQDCASLYSPCVRRALYLDPWARMLSELKIVVISLGSLYICGSLLHPHHWDPRILGPLQGGEALIGHLCVLEEELPFSETEYCLTQVLLCAHTKQYSPQITDGCYLMHWAQQSNYRFWEDRPLWIEAVSVWAFCWWKCFNYILNGLKFTRNRKSNT